MPQGNFNIRNSEIEAKLREIGALVKSQTPEGWGFSVLMFDFTQPGEDPGALFYISSADREDMLKAMKEFIKRNEH
jgi:hypothetical protein